MLIAAETCVRGQCATATTHQILSSDSTAYSQVALCCTHEAYTIYYLVFTQTGRSQEWVCGRSTAGMAGLNPAGRMDV